MKNQLADPQIIEYDEMAASGRDTIEKENAEIEEVRLQAFFDLRYIGQEFFLTIPVSQQEIYGADKNAIRAIFDQLHETRYGHKATDEPLEIVNVRLAAYGIRKKVKISTEKKIKELKAFKGYRDIVVSDSGKTEKCPVYEREAVSRDEILEGPAIIEEYASTTFLSFGDKASISKFNDIVITIGEVK